MKRTRTAAEEAALRAARGRALFMAGVGLVTGLVMLALSSDFLALHCVVAAAVAASGGIAAARSAILHRAESYGSAGSLGGIYAALGYALPFMVFNFVSWLNVTEETAAARAAQLSPEQIAQLREMNFVVGADFFRGQDIAYLFGYLLFALVFGWLFGRVGGIIALRQAK